MLHRDETGHKGYSLPSLEGRGWGWVGSTGTVASAPNQPTPDPSLPGRGEFYPPNPASSPGVSTCGNTVGSAAPGA